MPGTLLTATFVTGGSVTVDDSIAVTAITSLTSAIAANTVAINTTMGVIGASTPGNVANSTAITASKTADIVVALGKIEEMQRTIVVAIQGVQASIDTNTKAVAAIASATRDINIMAQTAVADQLKNNAFQQKVTNNALVEAGKPPVEVPAAEMKKIVSGTLEDMKNMSAIQFTYKAVDQAGTMLVDSSKWALKWSAETKVGKFFVDTYAQGEIAVVGLFSKEKSDQLQRELDAKISKAQSGKS